MTETQNRTDAQSYQGKDSGCDIASEALGGLKSRCLECPFPKCIYDNKRKSYRAELKYRRIYAAWKEGKSEDELCMLFGVNSRTIKRALKRVRND